MLKRIELLAPAGSFECLKAAIYFGADAVYIGGNDFSLRAAAENFSIEEIKEAVKYCHSHNKKCYIACNVFARNSDFGKLQDYFVELNKIKPDALIISDIGLIELAKKYASGIALHISTQANISNLESAKFYAKMGAKRLILARELHLDEIKQIRDGLDKDVELEVFIHGAMCVSYSGRCLISDFLSNRRSNYGECGQPCRYEFEIRERGRGGEFLTLTESEKGSHILNSRDLAVLDKIEYFLDGSIASLKIEGRNKASYYVANIVNAYRRAIDSGGKIKLLDELKKSSHRSYFSGFYFGYDNPQHQESSQVLQTHQFVARVLENGKIELRNKIAKGDCLEILSPTNSFNKQLKVKKILDENGEEIEFANKVKAQFSLLFEANSAIQKLKFGDLLRKEV